MLLYDDSEENTIYPTTDQSRNEVKNKGGMRGYLRHEEDRSIERERVEWGYGVWRQGLHNLFCVWCLQIRSSY